MLFGDLIGDPARLGLDAAFPALFLALLMPNLDRPACSHGRVAGRRRSRWRSRRWRPPGVPIIAACASHASSGGGEHEHRAWWTVVLVGVATIAIKGAGPVLLGGKPLPAADRSA